MFVIGVRRIEHSDFRPRRRHVRQPRGASYQVAPLIKMNVPVMLSDWLCRDLVCRGPSRILSTIALPKPGRCHARSGSTTYRRSMTMLVWRPYSASDELTGYPGSLRRRPRWLLRRSALVRPSSSPDQLHLALRISSRRLPLPRPTTTCEAVTSGFGVSGRKI
jgi:hypothetical protein